MKAWLIYFENAAVYNRKYIEFYKEEGSKLGIDVRLILVEDLKFGVKNNRCFLKYQGNDALLPDFAVCRAIYPILNKHLEFMGIPVFNNSFVAEICNDKAKTCQYLSKTGIRMVDSAFILNSQVDRILTQITTPTVMKAVDGHGGSQVFLLDGKENSDHLAEVRDKIGSSDVVVQPLIGSRHQDLRVYVIGKEIIAAVLRTAKEGFRSNYSLGGDVRLYELSAQERKLVCTIMELFDFGLAGIDFIIGEEGELIFNEIEDVVGSRMLYQCSGINIVELYLKHIIKQLTGQT